MQIVIKTLLILTVLVIAWFLVRSTGNSKNVALRRLLLLVFVVLAVVSIIFPDVTGIVAGWVGVGRGTDLLLYLLVIAFLSYAVVSYRRVNTLEWKIADLAQELTIARSHPENLAVKPLATAPETTANRGETGDATDKTVG
ncbi:MAG: DUF2304 domain-containing protein [Varibaculum sp.]|nr:DUF2304 domain-containing protein [Varibaculum sp.]